MSTALLAELPTEDAVRAAILKVRSIGFEGPLDVFGPYPIEGIDSELGLSRPSVTAKLLPVFVVAAFFGYYVQRWCNAVNYPLNVGGRPENAGPSFVIITFETGVLITFFAAFALLLYESRLPQLHQPVFEVEGFSRASLDRFWVGIDAEDPTYDRARLEEVLRRLGAERFEVVSQEGMP